MPGKSSLTTPILCLVYPVLGWQASSFKHFSSNFLPASSLLELGRHGKGVSNNILLKRIKPNYSTVDDLIAEGRSRQIFDFLVTYAQGAEFLILGPLNGPLSDLKRRHVRNCRQAFV